MASWLDQKDIPIHLVRYEDMQADTIDAFKRALAFAEHAASDDEIRRAVALAKFDELQKQEREKGFREAPPKVYHGNGFFRRGIAGAWHDELTEEQVARIEAEHAPMMRRLGYEPVSAGDLARTG